MIIPLSDSDRMARIRLRKKKLVNMPWKTICYGIGIHFNAFYAVSQIWYVQKGARTCLTNEPRPNGTISNPKGQTSKRN